MGDRGAGISTHDICWQVGDMKGRSTSTFSKYVFFFFSNKSVMVLESVLDKHSISDLNSVI